MALSFMLIAGEASGDTLGAELVKALRAQPGGEDFRFFGAGGPRMAAAGVELAFDLSAHAVVGLWEVLKNYGKFRRFFFQLLDLAANQKPDYVVLIDYPGFNLRFARALRKHFQAGAQSPSPKTVYYVSPQIWAWHESRIHQMARDIDLMLAIFPFETSWYAERKPGFRVVFVGHPLVDRYARERLDIRASARSNLLLLPGSRVREVRKHLPVMMEAARRLQSGHSLRVEIVVPSDELKGLAESILRESAGPEGFPQPVLKVGGLAEALSSAMVAIAASGTVTMECASFGVPAVVIYKTSWSTYLLGRRFIRVNYLAMPNLLWDYVQKSQPESNAGDGQVYPEFIQDDASAENISRAAKELLDSPARRQAVQEKLERVIASLGEPGASQRGAKAILELK